MTGAFKGSPAETACRTEERSAPSSSGELASTRYSDGAWQRTVIPYFGMSSRRSAGSKADSCTNSSVPWLQGPRNTFHTVLAQPLAAVHQSLSSARRSNQYLACILL